MKMRSKHVTAVLLLFAGLLVIPGLYWIGGFNFDERGSNAVFCALTTFAVAAGGFIAAMTYPGWQE